MVYEKQTSHAQGTALKTFLTYVYSNGEGLASQAGYAALPASIVTKAQAQLSKIQIPA